MRESSRRRFLKACGTAIAGLAVLRPAEAKDREKKAPGAPKTRVVVARRPDAIGEDFVVKAPGLRALFESAMKAHSGGPDAASAFRKLFRPEDRVGIKVNCIAGKLLSTHSELVALLVEALRAAGVPEKRIVIWDRTDRELKRAGFTLNRDGAGPLCYGTEADYEPNEWVFRSVASRYSRILTRQCTALIVVPVLKDHGAAGVTGAHKTHYGSIHNPDRYHGGNCSPYCAEISVHPAIRDRLRLVVIDGLLGQYQGGPGFRSEHAWPWGGCIVSTDPVASDRILWKVIEEKRKEKGLPSLQEDGRAPVWIAEAEKLGLGTADLAKIDEVQV